MYSPTVVLLILRLWLHLWGCNLDTGKAEVFIWFFLPLFCFLVFLDPPVDLLIKVFKPTEVQNIQRGKGMKINPLLLTEKMSGISKNRCPIYSRITVQKLAGTSVHFTQESLSGLGKNMQYRTKFFFLGSNSLSSSLSVLLPNSWLKWPFLSTRNIFLIYKFHRFF